jgi:DNA primase
MQNKRDDIDRIKASLSITEVATALGIQVQRGKFKCLYPMRHAHGDRTPSVSISEEKGLFTCWVCEDMRGDVIELVKQARSCSFLEAIEWLKTEFLSQSQINGLSSIKKIIAESDSIVTPKPPKPEIKPEERMKVVLSFLKRLSVVDGTPAARWLVSRRVFKPAWDKMRLRYISDYNALNKSLLSEFGLELLQKIGLYNDRGNLRYYKHPLIFPYLDEQVRSLFFQARTIDSSVVPKELNLKGEIPYPYNKPALNQKPGWVYLCEGVVDTLTLISRNIEAVGVPGVRSFKPEWVHLFAQKKVVLCFDQDEPGREATKYVQSLFERAQIYSVPLGHGIEDEDLKMKEGQDINDWFNQRK